MTNQPNTANSSFEPLGPQNPTLSKNLYLIAVIGAFIALFIKLYLAVKTLGTNDILFWQMFIVIDKKFGGVGLYQRLTWYNHPPMMIHILRAIDFLATTLNISFAFLFRLMPIFADFGSFFLVYKLLKNKGLTLPTLLLFALAPVSIMISGFHGNTDPIMIFFVLLSIYLIETELPNSSITLPTPVTNILAKLHLNGFYLAGMVLAIALSIKITPIILVPAIFLYLPNYKNRFEYFLSTAILGLVVSSPFIFQGPQQIFQNTFGYKSFYGYWGITKFLLLLPPEHWVNSFYRNNGMILVATLIVAFSFWANLGEKKTSLFLQIGFIFFLFMFLTPGFSVQYLAWLTPWVLAIGVEGAIIYYLTSGLFLALVYNWWAGGWPWNFASADAGTWEGVIYDYETICYASVVIITVSLFTYIATEKYPQIKNHLGIFYQNKLRYSFLVLIIIFALGKAFYDIGLNYNPRLHAVEGPTHENRQKQLLSSSYATVSAWYFKAKMYDEFVKTCNYALELNPDNADGYGLFCTYYLELGDLDKAIETGTKAVKLNPLLQRTQQRVDLAKKQKLENKENKENK